MILYHVMQILMDRRVSPVMHTPVQHPRDSESHATPCIPSHVLIAPTRALLDATVAFYVRGLHFTVVQDDAHTIHLHKVTVHECLLIHLDTETHANPEIQENKVLVFVEKEDLEKVKMGIEEAGFTCAWKVPDRMERLSKVAASEDVLVVNDPLGNTLHLVKEQLAQDVEERVMTPMAVQETLIVNTTDENHGGEEEEEEDLTQRRERAKTVPLSSHQHAREFMQDTTPLFMSHPGSSMSEQVVLTQEPLSMSSSSSPPFHQRKIAVLTSGGDSAGMNPAVRAIVRFALAAKCIPYAVFDGYQGLVDGGNDRIRKMQWNDVRGMLPLGGTLIGSARCSAFKTRQGRLAAAKHLCQLGIDALVVIGGDGSLTGADVFRQEWPGLLQELVDTHSLAQSIADAHQHLTIVGLVGSIDNDMSSTDLTIGAVTSLHRICEAVDCIASTAASHARAFVVEVMGRHCGWLALMAAISTGADYVLLPERPPVTGWEGEMCDLLQKNRDAGKRKSIVIVAEGAIDSNLAPIKADHVKQVLDAFGLDTRITTLGHVQRGGTPCFFDRFLATVQGVEAVKAVLRAKPNTPSPMIGISRNKITSIPLMKAVELTHGVSEAIQQKNFMRAMELRDPEFEDYYNIYTYISKHDIASIDGPRKVTSMYCRV